MDQRLTISAQTLMTTLGTARAPLLIDVCIPEDIAAEPWRLPCALHVPHTDVLDWFADTRPAQPIVVICQKGLKLSHGAAAALRSKGADARQLDGGNLAWFARDLPRLALGALPARGAPWVLPAAASVSDLCAAWLIRRWFDRDAPLMWVPADMVKDVATRFDAFACDAKSLTLLAEKAELRFPLLTRFLQGIDTARAPWLSLIPATKRQYPDHEASAAAVLPLLDAAWIAHQMDDTEVGNAA